MRRCKRPPHERWGPTRRLDQCCSLTLVEEYGGKHDDGVVAMATQDAIALNTHTGLGPFRADCQRNNGAYLDPTGSAVPVGMQLPQFLEALRPHAHATTIDLPRAPEAMAGLHSALVARTLTPEQMLGELTIATRRRWMVHRPGWEASSSSSREA